MQRQLIVNNTKISYSIEGNGNVVTLLHGYMSSSAIWSELKLSLTKKYKTICIDLPGHGNSETPSESARFSFYAECVFYILKHEEINQSIFIGHSLGGYVTLHLMKHYKKIVKGFILMHSHPYADNEERKIFRQKEAQYIKKGQKEKLISLNIHRSFHENNFETFINSIELIKTIAINTSDTGCVYALEAMQDREASVEEIENTTIPFLIIYSLHDPYLPKELIESLIVKDESKLCLTNSAHYGFIEEFELCKKEIHSFIKILT